MATRRTFDSEFKREAVRLVKERGVAISQAARDFKKGTEEINSDASAYGATATAVAPMDE